MKLAIFDVDETLVNVQQLHRKAYLQTMKDVFKVDCGMNEIDHAGKLLKDNLVDGAKLKGVSGDIEHALRVYEKNFRDSMPEDGSSMVLPGVVKLLDYLKSKGFLLAVVTGETNALAETVLSHTGLRDYFEFLVTSDGFKDRREMVEHAISKVKAEKVYLTGDTIHDVDAAKGIAVSIGVATGEYSKEQLMEHKPDYCFEGLDKDGVKEVFR